MLQSKAQSLQTTDFEQDLDPNWQSNVGSRRPRKHPVPRAAAVLGIPSPMNPLVIPHDPQWAQLFIREQTALREALGNLSIAIHHIGSTSIPDILAKPIIDILIEVASLDGLDTKNAAMQSLGYEVMGEFGIETRRYFRKSNAQGIRTHHIHAFETGSPHLQRHLAFRDYLIAYPAKAQEYSRLKADLVAGGNTPPEVYINGKSPFIKETESQAISWLRSTQ